MQLWSGRTGAWHFPINHNHVFLSRILFPFLLVSQSAEEPCRPFAICLNLLRCLVQCTEIYCTFLQSSDWWCCHFFYKTRSPVNWSWHLYGGQCCSSPGRIPRFTLHKIQGVRWTRPLGLVPLCSQVITVVCFSAQKWGNTPVCTHTAIAKWQSFYELWQKGRTKLYEMKNKGEGESLGRKARPRPLFSIQIRSQVPSSSPLIFEPVLRKPCLRKPCLLLRVTVSLCVDPKLTCLVNHVEISWSAGWHQTMQVNNNTFWRIELL